MAIKVRDGMKYKIGEFSKITGIPVKTLRYYDEIDLFKPSEIDLFSGYRYYKEEQIESLKIILELKEAGFLLEEIKSHWNSWNDEILLKQKTKLYEEQENLNLKIKKIDELRTRLQGGMITSTPVKAVLRRRKSL